MCVFSSEKEVPPLVLLSLRTLQYLVVPLLSIAMIVLGALHVDGCPAQPLLPTWHMVAGATGVVTPALYLAFDCLNPWVNKRCPALAEAMDNVIVVIVPVYILFEVAWLVVGTVWTASVDLGLGECDKTIYVFSIVVMVNFWIHVLTPITFMFGLCCTRIFPYCGYCAYWNVLKTAMDAWTRGARMAICVAVSVPMAVTMIATGAVAAHQHVTQEQQPVPGVEAHLQTNSLLNSTSPSWSSSSWPLPEPLLVPVWLLVAGSVFLIAPMVYLFYDKYCKDEDGGPLIKRASKCVVVFYLLCGLAWAVVGFVWVFATDGDTIAHRLAFAALIFLNAVMDVWICFKICVVMYWAFLQNDD